MRFIKLTLSMILFLVYSICGAFGMGKLGAYVHTIPFFSTHDAISIAVLILSAYLFWVSMMTLIHLILTVWLKEPSSYANYKAGKFITGYYFVQDCKSLIKGTTGWLLNKIKERIRLLIK